MKTTFNATTFHSNLEDATIVLYIFDECKYNTNKEPLTYSYTGVTSWDLIAGGDEAREIEENSDIVDDYNQYLVLHFSDGTTATFRNSYVDMFIR